MLYNLKLYTRIYFNRTLNVTKKSFLPFVLMDDCRGLTHLNHVL